VKTQDRAGTIERYAWNRLYQPR